MKNLIVRTIKSLLQITWDIIRLLILALGNVLMRIGKTFSRNGYQILYTLFVFSIIRALFRSK